MDKLPKPSGVPESKFSVLFGVASLGLFLLGVGVLASLVVSRNDWKNVQVVEDSTLQEDKKPSSMTIDVAGAVEHPGVFHLSADSRVQDALAAAGGLSASADRNWISRNINMAQKISDGVKIFIPSIASNTSTTGTTRQKLEDSHSGGQASDRGNQINVNTATASELETLWGVGEVRAQAVIDGRPYGAIDELVTKKILPKSVVEKNRAKLAL